MMTRADNTPTTDYSAEPFTEEDLREAETYFEAQRRWTWRRFVLLLITLLLIAMLVVYVLLPAIQFYTTPLPSRPLSPPVML